jgi:hypothetical protein
MDSVNRYETRIKFSMMFEIRDDNTVCFKPARVVIDINPFLFHQGGVVLSLSDACISFEVRKIS